MLTRRQGLHILLAAVCSPAQVLAAGESDSRSIWLRRGDQELNVEYIRDGQLQLDAYTQLCWLLRDVQAGQQIEIDPQVLAVLHTTQTHAMAHGHGEPIQVLSGYRTQATNRRSAGAPKSYHLVGQAVDFRLPGLSARQLGQIATHLTTTGVGVYRGRDFLHVDTGGTRGRGA